MEDQEVKSNDGNGFPVTHSVKLTGMQKIEVAEYFSLEVDRL